MSTTSQETAARPFRFPSAFTILFGLIILVAALTWIIPAGQYQRVHNAALDRDVPIAGTYQVVDPNPQSIVICAGGGGIPVMRNAEGDLVGIEAVIDKDRAAGLLATELAADALLMLTDVEAVYENWGTSTQASIQETTPAALAGMSFAAGSMGPKVESACAFASIAGLIAGIGRLEDARAILEGRKGTIVRLPEA